jgi:beta-galactosidase/beta-glucuronidase
MAVSVPRSEYPRPELVRADWLCLNGTWQFEIDAGDTGLERGLCERELASRIIVPFCPESELSGIGNTDFLNAVWYRREVDVPAAWSGRRILLHFQAVDYDATVWVNGVEVARHRGGFTPFSCDLGGVAEPGARMTIVVRARDPRGAKPGGKQSPDYGNSGCMYTRTTGIWQSVWLEPVADSHLSRPRITPDVPRGCFDVVVPVRRPHSGLSLRATLRSESESVATAEVPTADFAARLTLSIPEDERRLWSPADPHLYDLELELLDAKGNVVDRAQSYAGLRSVTIDGKAVCLNGRPVFQRLVLDQGYYPDGILTAPSDQALVRDIELSLAAGFNGARLHQKVFEERFLYHADRLGYLVWGELPDWGIDRDRADAGIVTTWLEALERDYSHPCIVGWCPLNETGQDLRDDIAPLDDLTRALFLATKAFDLTRPVLDASGYSHRVPGTDIYDCHDYEQDPERFRKNHAGLAEDRPFVNTGNRGSRWSVAYCGQPYFVSEFGGIWWNPDAKPGEASWGYGNRPESLEEFYTRFEGLCRVLLEDPNMFGYCYTQLTDVYQEQNGVYRFDRSLKLDMSRIRAVQTRRAAMENG